jgi:hypothetical protein
MQIEIDVYLDMWQTTWPKTLSSCLGAGSPFSAFFGVKSRDWTKVLYDLRQNVMEGYRNYK